MPSRKYTIYCRTEDLYVDAFETKPNTCPNNPYHDVDLNQIRLIDDYNPQDVLINEEDHPTGGNYQVTSFEIETPANQNTRFVISYPYPVNVLRAWFITDETHIGDILNIVIEPDMIVGAISIPHIAGVTRLTVTPTVIQYIVRGGSVKLYDTQQQKIQYLGFVLDIDNVNNTIKLENPLNSDYNPGSYILFTRHYVKNYRLAYPFEHVFNQGRLRASYIPSNKTINVDYTNNNEIDKSFVLYTEILY